MYIVRQWAGGARMSGRISDTLRNKRKLVGAMTAALCVVLLVLPGCSPSQTKLAKVAMELHEDLGAREAAVDRLTDEALLAKVALNTNNYTVQVAAAGKLTDQALLSKVAVEAHDEGVRVAAVKRLTDQALLTKVALQPLSFDNEDVIVAAVEKLTDQALLAKIATKNGNIGVRAAAVRTLTDQALKAQIAMGDKEFFVKEAGLKTLTDQALLAKIAVEGRDVGDRCAAVQALTDKALVAKIAVEDESEYVRVAAVQRLTDQGLLARIAVEDEAGAVRCAAVKTLTDQPLLARIAIEDKVEAVRQRAVETITDQALLIKVALESRYVDTDNVAMEKAVVGLIDQPLLARIAGSTKWKPALRFEAIGKLTDQVPLRELARKDPQAAIRQASVTRITDDSFLVPQLATETSAAVRAAIIKALRDRNSLREVALTAYYREDRLQALERLKRDFRDRVSDVVRAHKALEDRAKALTTETDGGKLLALAMKGEFDIVRAAAAHRLSAPEALEQAALHSRDRGVLTIVLAKLEDKDVLNRIAATAEEQAMRLAAAHKAGDRSWQQVFTAATATYPNESMLGDAVAAVSLFSGVQAEAVDAVQEACLSLIRRGDESRIPELADLLTGYGTKALAEDYLNCGQPDLDAAARQWGSRHGYSVSTGSGSRRATWGDRK
jgi:hypothetical protein